MAYNYHKGINRKLFIFVFLHVRKAGFFLIYRRKNEVGFGATPHFIQGIAMSYAALFFVKTAFFLLVISTTTGGEIPRVFDGSISEKRSLVATLPSR